MKKLLCPLLPALLTMLAGCKKEQTQEPIKIGDFTQGGYVFYLDAAGQHGMVLAPFDVERSGQSWGCTGTALGVSNISNTVFGSGAGNTYFISQVCHEDNCAANYCNDLLFNGYNDWFLPSIEEMDSAVSKLCNLSAARILKNKFYWSSTENTSPTSALTFILSNPRGIPEKVGWAKTGGLQILTRPARSF